MKRSPSRLLRLLRHSVVIVLAFGIFLAMTLWLSSRPVEALPEYARRTGEPCATCHVSAGGGGPRTLRGLLWAARGRPDKVPTLPGLLIAPRVNEGGELYDIACAGCHGTKAEGLFAIGLVKRQIPGPAVQSFIRRGIPLLGMPAFEGQFTEEQLDALVTYVTGLASGETPPPPDAYPLPPAQFKCEARAASTSPTLICPNSRPTRIKGN
jgi:mono/diheme cytochrome c family protein